MYVKITYYNIYFSPQSPDRDKSAQQIQDGWSSIRIRREGNDVLLLRFVFLCHRFSTDNLFRMGAKLWPRLVKFERVLVWFWVVFLLCFTYAAVLYYKLIIVLYIYCLLRCTDLHLKFIPPHGVTVQIFSANIVKQIYLGIENDSSSLKT